MNYAALIVGNGRGEYLEQVERSIRDHVYVPIRYRVMVNDSRDDEYREWLEERYPDWTLIHTRGAGMAGAVQAGWAACTEADFVLHIEEDMLLTRRLPVAEAAAVLWSHPMSIAQMCWRREPWWGSPEEVLYGDQLAAICAQATTVQQRAGYTLHDFLFSLNPCLVPKQIIRLGWPSGPLGEGNESGMTARCRDLGFLFGSWGSPDVHESWARHIGEERGVGWSL